MSPSGTRTRMFRVVLLAPLLLSATLLRPPATGAGAASGATVNAGLPGAVGPAPAAARVASRDPRSGLARLLLNTAASSGPGAAAASGAPAGTDPAGPAAATWPEGAARQALQRHAAALFGTIAVALEGVDAAGRAPTSSPTAPVGAAAEPYALQHVRTLHSPGGAHVRCQQTFRGIPVEGAWVQVNLDRAGNLLSITSTFVPDLGVPEVVARVSPQQALAVALAAIERPGQARQAPAARLVIDASDHPARLVYRTTHALWAPFGDWVGTVDARSGRLLRLEDRMLRCKTGHGHPAARRLDLAPPADWSAAGARATAAPAEAATAPTPPAAAGPTATGSGLVFPANPLNGHPERYGARDGDNMDAFRLAEPLPRLDGTGLLRGDYADVLVGAGLTRANELGLTFNYPAEVPDGPFQEVNTYWHLDTFQDYLQTALGLTDANNRRTQVIVHGVEEDNSYYSQSSLTITFGDGGVDDSDDGEVVLHEYGHAVHDDIIPGWNHSGETGALGEGFGDYVAATFGDNALVAEWDATSYNPGPPPFLRRTDTPKSYADYHGEIHDDGEIVSAAWWDLRGRVGKTAADRLVVSSFYYMPFNPTFLDARLGLAQADEALYGGAHLTDIFAAFGSRGIGDSYVLQLQHDGRGDSEDVNGPYPISAVVLHSVPLTQADAVQVFWRVQGAASFGVLSLENVAGDSWSALLPGPGAAAVVEYYLRAHDDSGGAVLFPANAPAELLSFRVGPDAIPPTITHTPLGDAVPQLWPFTLRATVQDNIGVSSVHVGWSHNGTPQPDFALAPAGGELWEGQFPVAPVTPVTGDVIEYTLVAVDAAAARNQAQSGPHQFHVVAARALVLVLDDDVSTQAAAPRPHPEKAAAPPPVPREASTLGASANSIVAALNRAGFYAVVEPAATSSPPAWQFYDVVISSSGASNFPLEDAAYRQALVAYAQSGGKLIVEGGEVGHRAIAQSYTDVVQSVLHVQLWVADAAGSLTVSPQRDFHPIATIPHPLPRTIPLAPTGNEGDQDALLPSGGAYLVYGTQTQPTAAGVSVFDENAAPGSAQIVFLPFALSRISDATVADQLVENVVTYLVTEEGTPSASLAGYVHLFGRATDAAGAVLQLQPTGQSVTTLADGAWSLAALYPGSYRLVVQGPTGWETVTQDLSVAEGTSVTGMRWWLRQIAHPAPCETPGTVIPDNTPAGIERTLNIADAGQVLDVNCTVNIIHTYRGDLQVDLVSPSGTVVRLKEVNLNDGADNVLVDYDDEGIPPSGPGALSDFDGEPAAGDWTLRVRDLAADDLGMLARWCVTIEVALPSLQVDGPRAQLVPAGVQVSWTAQALVDVEGVNVMRSVDGGPLAAATAAPLPPTLGNVAWTDPATGIAQGSTLSYQLQLMLTGGDTELLPAQASVVLVPTLPLVYALHPPAPNPFNPNTTLRFDLPSAGRTTLRIYDMAGRLVATLMDQLLEAGSYAPAWDGRDGGGARVASGVYVVELRSGGVQRSRAVTLIK